MAIGLLYFLYFFLDVGFLLRLEANLVRTNLGFLFKTYEPLFFSRPNLTAEIYLNWQSLSLLHLTTAALAVSHTTHAALTARHTKQMSWSKQQL
jgi:hypothetical protein